VYTRFGSLIIPSLEEQRSRRLRCPSTPKAFPKPKIEANA